MKSYKKILLDGDVFVYQWGDFCEKKVPLQEDSPSPYLREPVDLALMVKIVNRGIRLIKQILSVSEMDIFISPASMKDSFRKKIYPQYKENRHLKVRPLHYDNIRAYLKYLGAIEASPDLEADDIIGNSQTDETVIVSIDKDLFTIPGYYYNSHIKQLFYVKDPGCLIWNPHTKYKTLMGCGFIFFCAQMIMGDAADNIPGLPRIGQKKAYDLLHQCKCQKDAWEIVHQAYKNHYDKNYLNYLELNADLLWIQRKNYLTYKDYIDEFEKC